MTNRKECVMKALNQKLGQVSPRCGYCNDTPCRLFSFSSFPVVVSTRGKRRSCCHRIFLRPRLRLVPFIVLVPYVIISASFSCCSRTHSVVLSLCSSFKHICPKLSPTTFKVFDRWRPNWVCGSDSISTSTDSSHHGRGKLLPYYGSVCARIFYALKYRHG